MSTFQMVNDERKKPGLTKQRIDKSRDDNIIIAKSISRIVTNIIHTPR